MKRTRGKQTEPAPSDTGDESMREMLDAVRRMSTEKGEEEFERGIIESALAGDAEEGRYALEHCAHGLVHGKLSERMRFYLADRLRQALEGIPLHKALCVSVDDKNRLREPREDWELPLAALAAILEKRGSPPNKINDAMSEANKAIHRKGLIDTSARRIRRDYARMTSWSEERLLHLMLFNGSDSSCRFPDDTTRRLLELLEAPKSHDVHSRRT